jgi:hypothetical protein
MYSHCTARAWARGFCSFAASQVTREQAPKAATQGNSQRSSLIVAFVCLKLQHTTVHRLATLRYSDEMHTQ